MCRITLGLTLLSCIAAPALGQITVPGANDSDGAFNPASNETINLALAPTGTWNGSHPNPGLGIGVYDPDKWAVVFRYSSVNIASGRTVTFSPHPSGAPVVWLVSGSATISGSISLSNTHSPASFVSGFSIPGPGGFRGAGSNSLTLGLTGGLGPGGGQAGGPAGYSQTDGAYASRQYGNSRIIPLIGGSGGRKPSNNANGQGGGGAILIAAQQSVTVNGSISSNVVLTSSSDVSGSGGAIRLVCDAIAGTGTLTATASDSFSAGDKGSKGRIRIETNSGSLANTDPVASFGVTGATAQLWPEDVMMAPPSVRVLSLGSNNIPTDPRASFEFPYADVNTATSSAQTITVECRNIPTGSDPVGVQAWNVNVRIVPRTSAVQNIAATYISGNYAQSIWEAQVTLPTGFSGIQARASMPPQ